jgi:hypothetical protein
MRNAADGMKVAGSPDHPKSDTGDIEADTECVVAPAAATNGSNPPANGGNIQRARSSGRKLKVTRWPGEASLLIDDVIVEDADGRERALFRVGSPLTLNLKYRATRNGSFPVIFAIALYRADGIKISQHISPLETVNMDAGERRSVRLEFPSMDLADGRYVVSVALHRDLDPYIPNETVRYDLLGYSFEFEIVGNPPLRTSLFVLPALWKL